MASPAPAAAGAGAGAKKPKAKPKPKAAAAAAGPASGVKRKRAPAKQATSCGGVFYTKGVGLTKAIHFLGDDKEDRKMKGLHGVMRKLVVPDDYQSVYGNAASRPSGARDDDKPKRGRRPGSPSPLAQAMKRGRDADSQIFTWANTGKLPARSSEFAKTAVQAMERFKLEPYASTSASGSITSPAQGIVGIPRLRLGTMYDLLLWDRSDRANPKLVLLEMKTDGGGSAAFEASAGQKMRAPFDAMDCSRKNLAKLQAAVTARCFRETHGRAVDRVMVMRVGESNASMLPATSAVWDPIVDLFLSELEKQQPKAKAKSKSKSPPKKKQKT
jgi:hypothetical protein